MKTRAKSVEQGFIALTTAVLLSIALLTLMLATSTGSIYARMDTLGNEYKRVSLGLSEACVNAALLKIAQNYTYTPATGGDTVAVGPDTCVIRQVVYGPEDPVTFRTVATIYTDATYPATGGSWSANKTEATVQNPYASVSNPPPTCSFTISDTDINLGEQVILQWSVAGSATGIEVVRSIGSSSYTIYSGASTALP
jgi:hypothetical protein